MLDNVIDINFYPTDEAQHVEPAPPARSASASWASRTRSSSSTCRSTRRRRVEFSDARWSWSPTTPSSPRRELARGARRLRDAIAGSKWDRGIFPLDTLDLLEQSAACRSRCRGRARLDWAPVNASVAAHGMRNSNTMAIAPTATISNISGCFPCIEPIYKNIYVKANICGEFTVVNALPGRGPQGARAVERRDARPAQVLRRQRAADRRRAGPLKAKYREAFEIDPIAALRRRRRAASGSTRASRTTSS